MDEAGAQLAGLLIEPADLRIPEAVIGEARFEQVTFGPAAEDELVMLEPPVGVATAMAERDRAVRFERLAVVDGNDLPTSTAPDKPHPSGQIPPEVCDMSSGRRLAGFDWH